MAIRSDISVDWYASPRIVTVDAPSTELTMQDLHDTLVNLEDDLFNMSFKRIVSSTGKDDLGGGDAVGITLRLLDAQVAFEARSGPDWVLCKLSGGNCTAVDEDGVSIDPRYPTAFTTVDRASSSSATTQNQADIEYAAFAGGITYDEVNGYAGTGTAPNGANIGTPRAPSNNVIDAKTIAVTRGLGNGFIKGDATFGSDTDIEGFHMTGDGKHKSTITVENAASAIDCTYEQCSVLGYLDGDSRIINCLLTDLVYLRGTIEESTFGEGELILAGTEESIIEDCNGTGSSIISCGGSGRSLKVRGFHGGFTLTNKTGTDHVSIDLDSGQVKLDMDGNFGIALTGITAGDITIRGVGKVVDATSLEHIPSGTYGSVTLINETLNPESISDQVWEDATLETVNVF